MPDDGQKRSSRGIAGTQAAQLAADRQGVGARQASSPPRARGGGYQGSRNVSKIDGTPFDDQDPRLAELRSMGLAAVHMRAAELLGFDLFDKLWRIYDSEPSCRTDSGDLRIRMRPYSSWLRFQRNRFMEALADEGLSAVEIQARIELELREKLSERHISRIVNKR